MWLLMSYLTDFHIGKCGQQLYSNPYIIDIGKCGQHLYLNPYIIDIGKCGQQLYLNPYIIDIQTIVCWYRN